MNWRYSYIPIVVFSSLSVGVVADDQAKDESQLTIRHRGIVVDENDKPISGAMVLVESPQSLQERVPDASLDTTDGY